MSKLNISMGVRGTDGLTPIEIAKISQNPDAEKISKSHGLQKPLTPLALTGYIPRMVTQNEWDDMDWSSYYCGSLE